MGDRSNNLKYLSDILEFDRPLIIFDIETTGRSISHDKIIQIAYFKEWPNGRTKSASIFLNPGMPISPEATAVSGIMNEDVCDAPTFKQKAQELWEIFRGCFYAGFNIINFDLPVLRREFIRAGMDFFYETKDVIDAKRIFQYMAPATLPAVYKYYCQAKMPEERSVCYNVEATAQILLSQFNKYREVKDWTFLNKIHSINESKIGEDTSTKIYWKDGEAYFAFTSHVDKPISLIAEENPEFLEWMLGADFSDEIKTIVEAIIRKKNKEQNI